jgi:hypothetical protein
MISLLEANNDEMRVEMWISGVGCGWLLHCIIFWTTILAGKEGEEERKEYKRELLLVEFRLLLH